MAEVDSLPPEDPQKSPPVPAGVRTFNQSGTTDFPQKKGAKKWLFLAAGFLLLVLVTGGGVFWVRQEQEVRIRAEEGTTPTAIPTAIPTSAPLPTLIPTPTLGLTPSPTATPTAEVTQAPTSTPIPSPTATPTASLPGAGVAGPSFLIVLTGVLIILWSIWAFIF